MAVKGKEVEGFSLWTGRCNMKVVSINPNLEEIIELTGLENPRDPEYSGVTQEGNAKLRLDVYLKNPELNISAKAVFWLEDEPQVSKRTGSTQYVNSVGNSIWSKESPESNPNLSWFWNRDYREAFKGEASLYTFLQAWSNIDTRAEDSEVKLETPFSDIVGGDLSELNTLVEQLFDNEVGVLLGVKDGKYQVIYGNAYVPGSINSNKRIENQLENDSKGGYDWQASYQGSLELQKYTGQPEPTNTVSSDTIDVEAVLGQ